MATRLQAVNGALDIPVGGCAGTSRPLGLLLALPHARQTSSAAPALFRRSFAVAEGNDVPRLRLPGNANVREFTRNVGSAYAVQLSGYALVLLTVPYLARTLGAEGFGRVAIALSAGALVGTFIEYGMDVTATRELALAKGAHVGERSVSQMGADILAARVGLALIASALSGASYLVLGVLEQDATAFAWGIAVGLASTFHNAWYFYGREKHYRLNALVLAGKLIYTVGIFAFIRSKDQVWLVVCLNAVQQWLVALGTMTVLVRAHGWSRPTIGGVRHVLRAANPIFVLRLVAWLTSTASPLILGGIAGATQAGYYAAAGRLMTALTNLQRPLVSVLFPRVSVLAQEQPQAAREWLNRGASYMTLFGIVVGVGTFATAEFVTEILFGEGFDATVVVLRILSVFPLLFGLAQVYGSHGLLAMGQNKTQAKILVAGGIFFVPAAALGVYLSGATGMAVASVLTQLILVVLSVVVVRRLHSSGSGSA